MIGLGTEKTALEDFGTFGDIYGSLNTLFTSATLIIVMYSAYLQRQANQDAREAMEKQLQQAREDTEKQLEQARKATEQQIRNAQQLADIQLEHARQTSKKQLELAQATHDAQIQESKNAIFSNAFFNLLSHKYGFLNNIKSIDSNGTEIRGNEVFDALVAFFIKNDEIRKEKVNLDILKSQFFQETINLNGGKGIHSIYSYIYMHLNIFNLIDNSYINEQDKKYYLNIFKNSISTSEQIFIFFYCPFYKEFLDGFKNKGIFHTFKVNDLLNYLEQFYDESYFS